MYKEEQAEQLLKLFSEKPLKLSSNFLPHKTFAQYSNSIIT